MFKARSITFGIFYFKLLVFIFYLLVFICIFRRYLSLTNYINFGHRLYSPCRADFYRCIHPHRFNFRHYPIAFIVMLGINFRFGGCLFLTFSLAIEILGRQRIREGPQPATETQSATRHDFNIQQFRERGHCRVVHLPGKFII